MSCPRPVARVWKSLRSTTRSFSSNESAAAITSFRVESLDIVDMFEGPRGVVVVSHWVGRGRSSGAPLGATLTHVFEMDDGVVLTYRWFRSVAEGRAAAGL